MTALQRYPAARRIAAIGAVALLPLAVAPAAGPAKGIPTWTAVTALTSRPGQREPRQPGPGR